MSHTSLSPQFAHELACKTQPSLEPHNDPARVSCSSCDLQHSTNPDLLYTESETMHVSLPHQLDSRKLALTSHEQLHTMQGHTEMSLSRVDRVRKHNCMMQSLEKTHTYLVAAYSTLSATSAAFSGMMPSYTADALSSSPEYRTLLNSVCTAPGLMAVTRMSVPTRSCRAESVKASMKCLVPE